MKYINEEMQLQDSPCEVTFTLFSDKVNTIRYKSEPYQTIRGKTRQFDLYVPREVFEHSSVPEILVLQIGAKI